MTTKRCRAARLICCIMMTAVMALPSVLAEPLTGQTWAAELQVQKFYSANAELGAYLDKALLEHRAEIVFYTKDRSMMNAVSPTMETRLEYCSLMLYGIKHDKSIRVDTIMDTREDAQTASYYKVTIKPKYRYSKANDRKFYNRVQSVAKKAKKKKGVKSRAKYINNYITKKVKYNTRRAYHNTAYVALMKGRASCQGYTDLFTLIGRQAGLNVETVCGHARFKRGKWAYHAWNVVKSGSKWVQTDTTFNDMGSRYKYFMIRKKKFNRNHRLDMFYNNAAWKRSHPLK